MKTLRPILSLPLVLALLASPACIEKTIGIRSDPPGATVYLDGLEIGRTPIENVPFYFYGTREIAVHKSGYLGERRLVEMTAPWYDRFPVDLVTELVLPWTFRDQREYYFALDRTLPIEDSALLRNAYDTKQEAEARIAGARARSQYQPRAFVVKGAEKPSVLWGPLVSPPRTQPAYLGPRRNEVKDGGTLPPDEMEGNE